MHKPRRAHRKVRSPRWYTHTASAGFARWPHQRAPAPLSCAPAPRGAGASGQEARHRSTHDLRLAFPAPRTAAPPRVARASPLASTQTPAACHEGLAPRILGTAHGRSAERRKSFTSCLYKDARGVPRGPRPSHSRHRARPHNAQRSISG